MTDESRVVEYMDIVPTEILYHIFNFLPKKEIMKCRRVCFRWKLVVDRLGDNPHFWIDALDREFSDCYWPAKCKARNLDFYNLYRSLCLWSKLTEAVEEIDEFASASILSEEICKLEALHEGVIGIHKKCAIEYYDCETLKNIPSYIRSRITGDYAGYAERESFLVIQSYQLQLYVIRKIFYEPDSPQTTFDNVKMYYLTSHELYYVTTYEEVYHSDVTMGRDITSQLIWKADQNNGILCLGYTNNCLNILTHNRNIYSMVNNKDRIFKEAITNDSNLLNVLHRYNFLVDLDWRVYFQWMYVLRHRIPDGPMRDIIKIRPYGHVFFVGTNSGILTIFYRPYKNGEIDLFNSVPLKQINFMERCDIPVLSTCPILDIDVVENPKGHSVFVAMPKKVAVLKYTYNGLHDPVWTNSSISPQEQWEYLDDDWC